jgi:HSP20 family molecular chaperone IbpA
MEISPSRNSGYAFSQPQKASQKSGQSRSQEQSGEQVSAQEREIHRRLSAAERHVQETERSAEAEAERIRNDFQSRQVAETEREESSLQAQRRKFEENLQELKRSQYAELNKLRRESEDELAKMKEYYLKATRDLERHGDKQLSDIEFNNSMAVNYESKSAETQLADRKAQHQKQMELYGSESEEQRNLTRQSMDAEREKLRENMGTSLSLANQHYEERYRAQVDEHNKVLSELDQRTSQKLRDTRRESSQKLASYSERNKDPFYTMKDIDFKIKDDGDQYIISAKIPQHEQKNVSVVIRGNQIVVGGYRRNEEKIELEQGHTRSTASYQTYQEAFPLPAPVEAKELSRRFEGDRLIVSVPKKKVELYQNFQATNKNKPGAIRAQRPDFPENIDLPENGSGPQISKKTPGSSPLG